MVAGLCTRVTEYSFDSNPYLNRAYEIFGHLRKYQNSTLTCVKRRWLLFRVFHQGFSSIRVFEVSSRKGRLRYAKLFLALIFNSILKPFHWLSLAFTCKNKVVVSLQTQSVFSSLFGQICHQCDITRLYCWRHHCRRHLCQNGILTTKASFEGVTNSPLLPFQDLNK